MAIGTATRTFKVSDYLKVPANPRRTKVYVTTNVPGDKIIDKTTGEYLLGSGRVVLNAAGEGALTVPTPGPDANPSSWQTTVHFDYEDSATHKRAVLSAGPFTITSSGLLSALDDQQTIPPDFGGSAFLAQVEAISGLDTVEQAIDLKLPPALAPINAELTGRLSDAALATKVAAGVQTNRAPLAARDGLIIAGDSYAAGGATGGEGTEYPRLTRALLDAPPFLLDANSGFTSTQIAARVDAVLAANPGFAATAALVEAGMNDALQNTPRATTKAAYLQMRDALHARGIMPVFTTPPPHYTETVTARSRPITAWLIDNAAKEGWLTVDLSGLVDPATGNMAAKYRYDDIHVNGLGQTVIAEAARDVLRPLFPRTRRRLPNAPQAYDNRLPNALFGGTVTSGWPAGWSTLSGAGAGPGTPTVIDPTTTLHPGWRGKVFRMTFASGAASYGWKVWTGTNLTPNVPHALVMRLRLSGMPATIASGTGVQLQCRWSTGAISYVYGPIAYSGSDMLLDFPVTPPTGATGCDVALYWTGGAGVVDVGEVGLLDLTARAAA